eukprot:44131-Ditylum_brightwellii.AAC.1
MDNASQVASRSTICVQLLLPLGTACGKEAGPGSHPPPQQGRSDAGRPPGNDGVWNSASVSSRVDVGGRWGVLAPFYVDDVVLDGPAVSNALQLSILVMHGPDFGYFPEPDKSIHMCDAREDVEAAKAAFAARGMAVTIHDSHQYVKGFIGGMEWQYLQRTVPGVGQHMGALEAVLVDDFIPV